MSSNYRWSLFLFFVFTCLLTGAAAPTQADNADRSFYIIELNDPPLAAYQGGIGRLAATSPDATGQPQLDANSPASLAYRTYLAQAQSDRLAELERLLGRSIPTTYHYQAALNGFALWLTAEEAAVAATLPGVAAVYLDEEHDLLTDAGPAWVGAAGIWDGSTTAGLPGTMGEGIIVGILDTGINSDHPSFADVGGDGYNHTNPFGSGTYVGWCNPGFAVQITCNDKLIGAWSYSTTGNNPEDSLGHGSHTASTAAGNVVSATLTNGAASTIATLSGVAPHANIIAYDVCLSNCPATAMVAGIDQAVLDGVDVLNMSISGGRLPYSDPVSLAFLNAVSTGIFVATSAGNSGPTALTTDHNEPWVQTVAATTHNRRWLNSLTGMSGGSSTPPADIEGASFTVGYGPAAIVYAGNYGNPLCPTGAFPAATFSGQIVVCDNGGGITPNVKASSVLAGGAGGVVIANDAVNSAYLSAGAYPLPGTNITYQDGLALKSWLAAGAGHSATLSGLSSATSDSYADMIALFSARGPNVGLSGIIKPDLAAPGVNIWAAASNGASPPEFIAMNGTSMASPHVAGAAALLRDLHPTWTPAMLRSALMLTADTGLVVEDGTTPAAPLVMGAGRLDLSQAGNSGLVMDETAANYTAANPALGGDPTTLNLPSLGDGDCVLQCGWQRTFTSVLTTTATWTVTISTPSGLNLAVSPTSFTLTAGSSQVVTVTAEVSSLTFDQWQFASVHLSDGAGGAADAHLPVAVLPVQTTDVNALTKSAPTTVVAGGVISYAIALSNTNLVTTTFFITDPIPANTTYVPGSATGGLVYNGLADELNTSVTLAGLDLQIAPEASPFGYVPPAGLGNVTNICLTSTACDETIINLGGLDFYYLGQHYNFALVSANGYLVIGTFHAGSGTVNQLLPSTADPDSVLAPFWTNLDLDGTSGGDPGSGYFYHATYTAGSATYRVFGWENAQLFGDPARKYTFQIWLEEGTDHFWFVYNNITGGLPGGTGRGLTVGLENITGSFGTTYFYRPVGTSGGSDVGAAPSVGTDLRAAAIPDTAAFTFAVTADTVLPNPPLVVNTIYTTGGPAPLEAAAATTLTPQPTTLATFTADGYTTVELTYSGAVPFTVDFYRSYDGTNQDVLLDTVSVTDPDGSQTFNLGTEIELVTSAAEISQDYYLLAVADSGSTARFEGVYQYPADAVFVHGSDTADTVTASGSVFNAVTVTFNSVSTLYTNAVTLRIRTHGDPDMVNLSAITFKKGSFIPYIVGGAGDDSLTGSSNDDTFVGGPGNDAISGGVSADTTSYADSPVGVTVNLTTNAASDGYGSTDTLASINNATGSAYTDTLTGNSAANILNGNGSNDTLIGQSGNDTLIGGAGNDTLNGSNGADTASYTTSPAAVTASLATNSATQDGFGTADTFTTLENLTGSIYGDNLTGDNSNNTLNGDKGQDTLIGGLGADTIQGQAGADTLYANSLASCADGAIDKLVGGEGTDTAYYNAIPDNDTVNANTEVQNACS
jgi:uncharacterized repeat protein (TIGR01451 family)